MFEILEFTEAHVASVTNRVEKHGDEDRPAVTIGIEITAANTILDAIDPALRHALYKAVDGQEQLPGIEPATPVLRCNSIDRAVLPTAHEGWTLQVDDSFDQEDPMTFGSVKVDKFSVEPKQGGSIVLRLRCGTSDVNAETLGKLAMHNGQAVWITLTAPKPRADAIDGTGAAFRADHPDATDLFTRDGGGPGDDDADQDDGSEGGETDVIAADAPAEDWPFPQRENNSMEAPPQSVTVERSQPGTRTARGREKTAKAIAAGKAAAAQGV